MECARYAAEMCLGSLACLLNEQELSPLHQVCVRVCCVCTCVLCVCVHVYCVCVHVYCVCVCVCVVCVCVHVCIHKTSCSSGAVTELMETVSMCLVQYLFQYCTYILYLLNV